MRACMMWTSHHGRHSVNRWGAEGACVYKHGRGVWGERKLTASSPLRRCGRIWHGQRLSQRQQGGSQQAMRGAWLRDACMRELGAWGQSASASGCMLAGSRCDFMRLVSPAANQTYEAMQNEQVR